MMYTVVRHFTDLQDNNHKYNEGDIYPREGYIPSAERIKMLSTAENKQKTALIAAIAESDTVETSVEEEPTSEEKPKRKRSKKAAE